MAYLAHDFAPATTAEAPIPSNDTAEAAFSSREWTVIRMARHDRARRVSRLGRLAGLIFGLRHANPLADPRLEALRQAAAGLWRCNHYRSGMQIHALLSNGYSFDQISLLSDWIAEQRAATR